MTTRGRIQIPSHPDGHVGCEPTKVLLKVPFKVFLSKININTVTILENMKFSSYYLAEAKIPQYQTKIFFKYSTKKKLANMKFLVVIFGF